MRATVMRRGELHVTEVPDPSSPRPGQVLVEVVACGICGSDLHVLSHPDQFIEAAVESEAHSQVFDPARELVLGHELAGRVIEAGADVEHLAPGDFIAALPIVVADDGEMRVAGFSNEQNGGYAERMLLQADACVRIPDGMDPSLAALAEPCAWARSRPSRSGIKAGQIPIVLGMGPIGLGFIGALRRRGIGPIIVSEPSELRRQMAIRLGADIALDPRSESWLEAWKELGSSQPPVIFNTTGRPGMLMDIMRQAPYRSHIFEVSGLMTDEPIRPIAGVLKCLTIQFSQDGSVEELATVVNAIAENEREISEIVTGRVGLDDVAQAFDELRTPNDHVKVFVEPNGRIDRSTPLPARATLA